MDPRPGHPIQAVQSFQVRAGKVGTRWLDVGIRDCNSARNDGSSWPRRSPIRSRCMKFCSDARRESLKRKRREDVLENLSLLGAGVQFLWLCLSLAVLLRRKTALCVPRSLGLEATQLSTVLGFGIRRM